MRNLAPLINLQIRLLISHLVVMAVGVMLVVVCGSILKTDFHDGWLAVWVFSISAIAMTWLTGKMLVQPLARMERTIDEFTEGNLQARIPLIPLPELNRLAVSFNIMASNLQRVEESRQELISDLAHELRSPITVIHGYLETIAVGMTTFTPEIQQQLQAETERLMRLTNNLLELARVESGYLPLCLERVALSPIFTGLLTTFSAVSARANCRVEIQILEDLPLVYVDRDRLKQILVNLLSNAIKYTPNGTVTIRAGTSGDTVWIAIVDTGIGIASEHLHKVFDRFWRADASRASSTGGSGIGLAITKRLVELQGGKIEVLSDPDRGSIFRFSLPIAR